jgi:3-oxoacyl-[acyl-carrier-protein] synthase-3
MPYFKYSNIRIAAVASAVPTKVIKVDQFKSQYGDDYVEKFKEGTGVEEFRKTSKYQTASDLGFAAAEKIISEKHINRDSIGALVFVSHSPDYRRPGTSSVLHKRLKLSKECAALDVNLGCSAFVYGMQVACSLLQCSDIERALLIVSESLTKMVYPTDKSVSMLFGDGGSAVLLEKTNDEAYQIKGLLKSDGNGYKAIIAPAGGFRNIDASRDVFTWDDGNERTLYNTHMNGNDVFAFTISDVPKTIKEFLEKTNTSVADYTCLAFHQANKFIHKQLSKKLKADLSKMPMCIHKYGNTSASSIPLLICDTYGNDTTNEEVNFLMAGFGVGLSWGVVSAKINKLDIYPVIETDIIFEEGIINSPADFNKLNEGN